MVLAHTNFMGGGHTLFMFFPFIFIGGGLAFMAFAAGDKRQTKHQSVRVLPVGAQHPLSHVRPRLKGDVPPPARTQEQKPATRRRSEPPWLKQV